jgi:nitrite reductase (NAD(P)H)
VGELAINCPQPVGRHVDPEQYSSFADGSLRYHLDTRVTDLDPVKKQVHTSTGHWISYDLLVLATGSDAVLPENTPGYNAKGVFVYRTISDLENLISFAAHHKGETGVTVGGGLLGLEAAKAMTDLEEFGSVKLVDRNKYVLARQLDADAGNLVTEKIRELGLDVMHQKRVAQIETDEENNVRGIVFEDGEKLDCCCVCFAVGGLCCGRKSRGRS